MANNYTAQLRICKLVVDVPNISTDCLEELLLCLENGGLYIKNGGVWGLIGYATAAQVATAQSAASNAQNTANTAASSAATGQTAANSAQSTANAKLSPNAPVSPATHTKITYDANGLVTSGVDLSASDVPSLPSSKITGLATVATSGLYGDLSGKPTIPSAQIQSDWSQGTNTSLDYIKNKPTIPTAPPSNFTFVSGTLTPVSITKRLVAIVTPTQAIGYALNISGMGFTNIYNAQVIGVKSTTDPNLTPQASISSVSTSSIVMNFVQGNAATVVLLGINVLSGAPFVAASLTGLTAYLLIEGN